MKKILMVVAMLVITMTAQAQKSYEMTIEFDRATKGYEAILEGSEVGTFYQLFYLDSTKQNIPIGDGLAGTGNALVFPTTTIAEIYIIATSKTGNYTIIIPTPKKEKTKKTK